MKNIMYDRFKVENLSLEQRINLYKKKNNFELFNIREIFDIIIKDFVYLNLSYETFEKYIKVERVNLKSESFDKNARLYQKTYGMLRSDAKIGSGRNKSSYDIKTWTLKFDFCKIKDDLDKVYYDYFNYVWFEKPKALLKSELMDTSYYLASKAMENKNIKEYCKNEKITTVEIEDFYKSILKLDLLNQQKIFENMHLRFGESSVKIKDRFPDSTELFEQIVELVNNIIPSYSHETFMESLDRTQNFSMVIECLKNAIRVFGISLDELI